jgi:hypothetical protein
MTAHLNFGRPTINETISGQPATLKNGFVKIAGER